MSSTNFVYQNSYLEIAKEGGVKYNMLVTNKTMFKKGTKMEQLRIAICDDVEMERERLKKMLLMHDPNIECDTYDSGEELLRNFYVDKYDLLFLDIYMTGLNGVEVLEKIRSVDEKISVAFVTTSSDFALEGYRLRAIRYVEKPVKSEAVAEILSFARLKKANAPHFEIKVKGEQISIPFEKIRFLEQEGHMVKINLSNGEMISVTAKLNDIEVQFKEQNFLRCHKSFLVNLAFVRSVDTELKMFVLESGDNVYIKRGMLLEAREAFEQYLYNTTRGLI
jgi:DNA-binding LytR/AlgR family response regulator